MANAVDARLSGGMGALLRAYWMLLGHIAIFVGVVIASNEPGLSWRDALPWLAAGSVMLARRIDVIRYHGTTADGVPATTRDVRWFMLAVVVLTGAVWGGFRALRIGLGI